MSGIYVSPSAYQIRSIEVLKDEVFGPILHVITYRSNELDKVIDEINSTGYGLTLGIQSRIDETIDKIKSKVIFTEELKQNNPSLLRDYYGEARFHPKEYPSMTDTMIYKDTIILFIWTAKPPIAVVIKSKDNAESYKSQFNLLWKTSKN